MIKHISFRKRKMSCKKKMEPKLKICVCKKDIRCHISNQLFPDDATTILTSATISEPTTTTPTTRALTESPSSSSIISA